MSYDFVQAVILHLFTIIAAIFTRFYSVKFITKCALFVFEDFFKRRFMSVIYMLYDSLQSTYTLHYFC